jgi:hypothetical protein
MVKIKLPEYFSLADLQINPTGDQVEVILQGERSGKPSKRFTLHGSGFKVNEASVQSETKHKSVDFQIERINYLPTFQEIRIHTKNLQYPGPYKIRLMLTGANADDFKSALNPN